MVISNDEPDIILITEVKPKNQENPISPSMIAIQGNDFYTNFKTDESNLGMSGIRGILI